MAGEVAAEQPVAVFVHGLFSDAKVWNPLISLLQADVVGKSFRLEAFSYASPRFELHPLKRIPSLKDAADSLGVWLRETGVLSARRIALIGHSQGGLVIQRCLSEMFGAGRADDLRCIRAVVLLATPNTGSELFLSLRKRIEIVWAHEQEKTLRPFDEEVETARRAVLERAVLPPTPSPHTAPIRFFVYAAASDAVVSAASAKWMFPNAGTLPGDHSSILIPANKDDLRFTAVRNALRWVRHSFPANGILITTEALDLGNPRDIDAVNELATELFEPGQAMNPRDLLHWLHHYQEEWALKLSVLVAKVNGELGGFLMFHEGEELILVDYIATRKGLAHGSVLVDRMVEQLKRRSLSLGRIPIVFEVEDPKTAADPTKARARIKVFAGRGACQIEGLEYLAPHMETLAPGDEIRHLLMYVRPDANPGSISKAAVAKILRSIYRIWYKNWFSHLPNAEQRESYLASLHSRLEGGLKDQYELRAAPPRRD